MTRDEQLSDLIRDAVSDVEPEDRIGELRARTTSNSSRRWWLTAGGSVLATAAAVTAIALVVNGSSPSAGPGPSTTPTGSAVEEAPTGPVSAVPAYFVGETPRGPRLYREFQQVVDPSPGLAGLALLESGPEDPDYESLWPEGSFQLDVISDPEAGVVHVYLSGSAPEDPSDLALQQVVYTVSAGFQEPLEVHLHQGVDGPIVDRVRGGPQLDVLSHVNLSDPFEGQVVGGDTLRVQGVANSNEANVLWTIENEDGSSGEGSYFTATGYMGERLFPFEGGIDVSSLKPGTYTLTVETDDPSGGAEGFGPFTDTRTFVIE